MVRISPREPNGALSVKKTSGLICHLFFYMGYPWYLSKGGPHLKKKLQTWMVCGREILIDGEHLIVMNSFNKGNMCFFLFLCICAYMVSLPHPRFFMIL